VLLAESTILLHPSVKGVNDMHLPEEKYGTERKLRSLKDNTFYTHFGCAFTSEFLESHGVFGFYCGMRDGDFSSKNKPSYLVPFEALMQMDPRVVFMPLPKLSKKFVKYVKQCSNQRMVAPDLMVDAHTGKHQRTLFTTEDIPGMLENVDSFFKDNFEVVGASIETPKCYVMQSLDDLMRPKVRKNLGKLGKRLMYERHEVEFYNYFYIIVFE